jgi:hypothetical protein
MVFQLAPCFSKGSESLLPILPLDSRSTSTLHLVTSPVITPKAASHGAKTTVVIAPAAPQVTGMDNKILPLSSLIMIRLILTSCIISFTFEINPSEGDMVATFNSWNPTFSGEDFLGTTANGNPFTTATVDLFRISNGQIVEHWEIGDYSNITQAVYG